MPAHTTSPNIMTKKIGRNDPCPCGSGKKYKKCCINSQNDFDFESTPKEKKSNTLDSLNQITLPLY